VIKQIYIENKIPIIVGGSHLYVDALIKNYDLSSFNERDNQFADLSTQELYERLKILDQGKAVSIINNRQRLLRALQIYTQTPSKLTPMRNKNKSIYNALIIECSNERQLIYNRVNKRIDDMLDNGWIDEVAKLIISYKNVNDLSAFKAIGYSEIYHSLLEHKKLDVDKIKQRTRQYVKRQLT
jgi:tRNA dimethylallyltransferase